MRKQRIGLVLFLTVMLSTAASAQACFGYCRTKLDTFPYTLVDTCNPSTTIGTLSHTIVCTHNGTNCSATGTIDWAPNVNGGSNLACWQCGGWDCSGSATFGSVSWSQGAQLVYYTDCSTATSTPAHWENAIACYADSYQFYAQIKTGTTTACVWTQRLLQFECGQQ